MRWERGGGISLRGAGIRKWAVMAAGTLNARQWVSCSRRAGLELGWVGRGAAGRRAGKGAHCVLGEGIGFDPGGAFSHLFIQEARQIWGRSPRVDG